MAKKNNKGNSAAVSNSYSENSKNSAKNNNSNCFKDSTKNETKNNTTNCR